MSSVQFALVDALVLIVANLNSFLLMKYDKNCAKKGKWRVPEATLFIATASFGGLGGVLGMKLLRHKTKHWYFVFFFPLMLGVQIVLLGVMAYYLFFK